MLKTAEIEEIYSKTSANRHLSRLQKKGFVYRIRNGEYFIPQIISLENPLETLGEEYKKYQNIEKEKEKLETLKQRIKSLKSTIKDIGNLENYFADNKNALKNKAIKIYNSKETPENKIKRIDGLWDLAHKKFWRDYEKYRPKYPKSKVK